VTRRLLPYGENAALLTCADLDDVLAVRAALADQAWPEIAELVPGAETVLLRLRAPLSTKRERELISLQAPVPDPAAADPVTVDVRYDGEDLAEVAALLQLDPAEVVRRHTGQRWTVAFCGFAPGFAYLHGEQDELAVPRRGSPRREVPAGAVGLADRWSGIYPRSGPGGWQLIGRTDAVLWDLDRDPPGLLQPGAVVRFRDAAAPDEPGDG
jgi:KipI family sensor histidine kinase inhibitor